jgi:molecular chaperone HtpG
VGAKDTFEFKTEIRQLLDILIHSLYTQKEIFLRELISNASDALDKRRWASGASAEEADGVLTIADTGIGMTREELIANIGTIAHSGSAEFVRAMAENKEGEKGQDAAKTMEGLIGRFGVGFYSVYMAADEVTVTTRPHGAAQGHAWTSDGQGSYTIEDLGADVPEGTSVRIALKPDLAEQFTDPEALKRIIKRHSNFVAHPIYVDGERVNTVPALWREPKFQVRKEQYDEFYQFLTYDTDEPLSVIHTAVDAPVQRAAVHPQAFARPLRHGPGRLGPRPVRAPRAHPEAEQGPRPRVALLRQGRGGHRGPAAEHLPRDAAGQPAHPQDPVQRGQDGHRRTR